MYDDNEFSSSFDASVFVPANGTAVYDQSGAVVTYDDIGGVTAPYDHWTRLSDKLFDFAGVALDNVTFNQRLQNATNTTKLKVAQTPPLLTMLTGNTFLLLAVVGVVIFGALAFLRR